MNFSELILHDDFNMKMMNDINKRQRKQFIKFKNIKLGEVFKSPLTKDVIIQTKKQLRQHHKANNNPRMSLIEKTKQLIQDKNEKYSKKSESTQHGRPKTSGSKFKGRYLSSSTSPRPNRYDEYTNHYSEMYPSQQKTKINLRDEFLQSTIKKIKLQKKASKLQKSQPEVMSLKMYRQFPPSKRKRTNNRSTLEEAKKHFEVGKRQNTAKVINRYKDKNSYQNLEPW